MARRWMLSSKRAQVTLEVHEDSNCILQKLVNRCFEPCQPLGIISGLKKTLRKRHRVERTSKPEIRPVEKSEKTESCQENLWNEIQSKEP